MKKQYSLGFVFTPNFERVLLIEKTHPYFQAGKLNGLGGKCEKGELPLACMSREMQEESGVAIAPESWKQITFFLEMTGKSRFLALFGREAQPRL